MFLSDNDLLNQWFRSEPCQVLLRRSIKHWTTTSTWLKWMHFLSFPALLKSIVNSHCLDLPLMGSYGIPSFQCLVFPAVSPPKSIRLGSSGSLAPVVLASSLGCPQVDPFIGGSQNQPIILNIWLRVSSSPYHWITVPACQWFQHPPI